MAYENLKNSIKQTIKQNSNQEITGDILQSTLLSLVNTVGEGATFVGVATPTTDPGTSEGDVFYIAQKTGNYINFPTSSNGTYITVEKEGLFMLTKNDTYWNIITLMEITSDVDSSKDKAVSPDGLDNVMLKIYGNKIPYYTDEFLGDKLNIDLSSDSGETNTSSKSLIGNLAFLRPSKKLVGLNFVPVNKHTVIKIYRFSDNKSVTIFEKDIDNDKINTEIFYFPDDFILIASSTCILATNTGFRSNRQLAKNVGWITLYEDNSAKTEFNFHDIIGIRLYPLYDTMFPLAQLKNKNIFFFGDSITAPADRQGLSEDRMYLTYLINNYGLPSKNLRNFAVGGATITPYDNGEYSVEKDSLPDGGINKNNALIAQFYYALRLIRNGYIAAPDVVFISAGTNDYSKEYHFGKGSDTTNRGLDVCLGSIESEYYASLNIERPVTDYLDLASSLAFFINNVRYYYNNALIVVVSPIQRSRTDNWQSGGEEIPYRTFRTTKVIKEVCENENVIFIDANSKSGIVREEILQGTLKNVLNSDGVHPEKKGAKMIAKCIHEQMKKHYNPVTETFEV